MFEYILPQQAAKLANSNQPGQQQHSNLNQRNGGSGGQHSVVSSSNMNLEPELNASRAGQPMSLDLENDVPSVLQVREHISILSYHIQKVVL